MWKENWNISSSLGVWLPSLSTSQYAVAETSEKEWDPHYLLPTNNLLPTYSPKFLPISKYYLLTTYLHAGESLRSHNSTPSQEIPTILGNLMTQYRIQYITACHLSLSWARSIQPTLFYQLSWWFILKPFSHLRTCRQSGLLPSGFPMETIIHLTALPATCTAHHMHIDHPNNTWWGPWHINEIRLKPTTRNWSSMQYLRGHWEWGPW